MPKKDFKSAAHDLNNILTSISNAIFYLRDMDNLNPNILKTLDNLENDSKRAIEIVQSFLQKETGKRQLDKIQLTDIVNEVLESVKISLPNNVNISVKDAGNMPSVIAYKTDLYRIILNLITNAIESLNGEGIIEIGLRQKSDSVIIEITDTGEGIPPENLSKIFNSNFSTKDKKIQSGLGLSFVKEKTEQYNGKIEVESNSDKTKFTLAFPALVKDGENKANLMIAEDDDSLREVLIDLLESYNYNVTQTTNGNALLKEVDNNSFDLLIIDKKIPGTDGLECIKQIREKGNTTPIILASGSNIDNDDLIKELKIDKIIKKPYSFPEIVDSIRKLI